MIHFFYCCFIVNVGLCRFLERQTWPLENLHHPRLLECQCKHGLLTSRERLPLTDLSIPPLIYNGDENQSPLRLNHQLQQTFKRNPPLNHQLQQIFKRNPPQALAPSSLFQVNSAEVSIWNRLLHRFRPLELLNFFEKQIHKHARAAVLVMFFYLMHHLLLLEPREKKKNKKKKGKRKNPLMQSQTL